MRHGEEKSKFLCGHDERHWFVAAVPEGARGVARRRHGQGGAPARRGPRARPASGAAEDRIRRTNAAFVRQGEWFFVPAPWIDASAMAVLRDEPLSRGGGNAHVLAYAFRRGGETVYVNPRTRTGSARRSTAG